MDYTHTPLENFKISGDSPATVDLMRGFLRHKMGIFAHSPTDLGLSTAVQHTIDTGSAAPVAAKPHRYSHADRLALSQHVDDMLAGGIVEPSQSPWRSMPVLADKKDGSTRFCINFRKLNDCTKKSSYPLPRIDDILDQLGGACIFSSLDARSGYWQIAMAEEDKEKTAFWSPKGLFHFLRMPFGLTAAPSTYQAAMDRLLDGLPFATCYLDDVLVFSPTLDQHLEHLDEVFMRFAQGNIRLHPGKCHFNCESLRHLGFIITAAGIAPDPAKISAVAEARTPQNITDVRSFLGLAGYYRKFVLDFSRIAAPLLQLLKKDAPWSWTQECTAAFQTLKSCLVRAPILGFPDFSLPFTCATDWAAAQGSWGRFVSKC